MVPAIARFRSMSLSIVNQYLTIAPMRHFSYLFIFSIMGVGDAASLKQLPLTETLNWGRIPGQYSSIHFRLFQFIINLLFWRQLWTPPKLRFLPRPFNLQKHYTISTFPPSFQQHLHLYRAHVDALSLEFYLTFFCYNFGKSMIIYFYYLGFK